MGSSSLELSLSLKPSYAPKTIDNLLKDLSKIDNVSDRLMVLNDYLHKHEEELSRIEAFKSQLPQCMLLLMDAIETLKEEVINIQKSKSSESCEKPLMDFLSMKRRNYEIMKRATLENYRREEKKSFTSSSSQLYELNHGQNKQKPKLDSCTIQSFHLSNKREGRGRIIRTLKDCSAIPELEVSKWQNPEVARGLGYGKLRELKFQSKSISKPTGKKNYRRAWKPELHARFVEALDYLGGPEVATPKQIREVMKVEGLTNDQVKSHLQKYRLHNRRGPAANVGTIPSNQGAV